MVSPDVDLEALLDGVWQRRRVELVDRATALRDALALAADGDEGGWQSAGAEAHRLAGALGTLGFHELGALAHALELALGPDAVEAAAAADAAPTAERLLSDLQSAQRRPVG